MQTANIKRSLPAEVRKKPVLAAPVKSPILQPAFATAFAHDTGSAVVEQTFEEQDKRPFMNMNQAPECPACGVSMLLHTEKRFLRKPAQYYICPNAPSCPETLDL